LYPIKFFLAIFSFDLHVFALILFLTTRMMYREFVKEFVRQIEHTP
jgi:hypothetical protein